MYGASVRRVTVALGLVAASLVASCERPRTELVVRVESEVPWGAGQTVQSVSLTVRRGGSTGPVRSARTTALGEGGERRPLPLLVGVVPGNEDDTETPVWIEALGCASPNGCDATTAAVAQRAVVRFARGQTQELTLLLASACLGMRCPVEQRCATDTGRCEAASRAQEMVGPFTGTDAGARDGATVVDAPTDQGATEAATADVNGDAGATADVVTSADLGNDAGSSPMDVVPLVDLPVPPEDRGAIVDAPVSVDLGSDVLDAEAPAVDVGNSALDAGAPDTGSRCTGALTDCGGRCADLMTSAAHCGMCGQACAVGAACTAGRCVGGVIPGPAFQVTLTPNNCATVDHIAVTGDDRGGIAVSDQRVFYSGDTSTGRFDLADLGNGQSVGRIYDALASDLATGTLYALANGSTPLTQAGGTVTTLIALNGSTGGFTGTFVNLSQPIELLATGSVGIFSGYQRLILLGSGRAWHVSLPGGAVIDLGAVSLPAARVACENWAIWGTAEFFDDALYVDYVQSATTIARLRVYPAGAAATLASFGGGLGDMCSFTVSPLRRRWFFHHEQPSQFRNTLGETIGYCDATIAGLTAS